MLSMSLLPLVQLYISAEPKLSLTLSCSLDTSLGIWKFLLGLALKAQTLCFTLNIIFIAHAKLMPLYPLDQAEAGGWLACSIFAWCRLPKVWKQPSTTPSLVMSSCLNNTIRKLSRFLVMPVSVMEYESSKEFQEIDCLGSILKYLWLFSRGGSPDSLTTLELFWYEYKIHCRAHLCRSRIIWLCRFFHICSNGIQPWCAIYQFWGWISVGLMPSAGRINRLTDFSSDP